MHTHAITRFALIAVTALMTLSAWNTAEGQRQPAQAVEAAPNLFDQIDIVVIPLEHATPSKVMKLMGPFAEEEIMTADDELGAIMLYGPKSITSRLAEAIKVLDMAHKEDDNLRNVELTIQLVQGSGKREKGAVDSKDIPDSLTGVIEELASIFSYAQYRLVDTLFLRCRDGSDASTSGLLAGGSEDSKESMYNFRVRRVSVTDGEPLGIRLDELSFSATEPVLRAVRQSLAVLRQPMRPQMGISADIDVREGQQVVVGKASVIGGDSALFIVVSAKVVGG